MPETIVMNEPVESFHDSSTTKVLSFNVYLSRYFKRSDENSLKRHRSVQLRLPTVDKQQKGKRPSFRLAVPHRIYPTDLSKLTARGTRPESKLVLKDDSSVADRQVPPPSPSDEQVEQFFHTFHQTSRPSSPTLVVPYRLPALNSFQRQRTDWNLSARQNFSSFDHY